MHEVRIDTQAFSLGVSTRSYGYTASNWRLWPMVRFLPLLNPTSAGADGLILDALHTSWYLAARLIGRAFQLPTEPEALLAPIRGRKGDVQDQQTF